MLTLQELVKTIKEEAAYLKVSQPEELRVTILQTERLIEYFTLRCTYSLEDHVAEINRQNMAMKEDLTTKKEQLLQFALTAVSVHTPTDKSI